MTVLAGFAAGLAGTGLVWLLARGVFDSDAYRRSNHRGLRLPTACGLVIVLGVLGVEAALAIGEAAGTDPDVQTVTGRRLVVLGGLAFALLGLLDDLGGEGESVGFRGHLRSLLSGRVTTGGIKLFGGAAVGIVLAASVEPRSVGRVLADGALIALCANLANLFDRAPGRVLKVSLLAFVALVAGTLAPAELFGPALVLGGAAALLVPDVRERLMIGDAGSNTVGAAIGIGLLVAAAPATRTVWLVVVVVLNLLSEVVSFSEVISRTPVLSGFDRLGRGNGAPST